MAVPSICAEMLCTVLVGAAEVTGISTHETIPPSASSVNAPIAKFSIDVSPAEKSYEIAPFPTLNPPANVDVEFAS